VSPEIAYLKVMARWVHISIVDTKKYLVGAGFIQTGTGRGIHVIMGIVDASARAWFSGLV
jgi:hypothetical protein